MKNTYLDEICDIFTRVKTKASALALLKDLLTARELKIISERFQIFKMLKKGMPQRQISSKLKISIAKVEHGSKALKRHHGGVLKFIGSKTANWRD